MNKKGLLITFEGGDGSGKSTHAELFKNYLTSKGLEFFATREPGGTDFSEAVRALTKDLRFKDKSLVSEVLLFESARADIVEKRIIPALNEGKIVIMDRFYDSTTAYQSFGRGLDRDMIQNLNLFASHNLVPDITYYMRITPQNAFVRKGGEDCDVLEKAGLDFHERVQFGFDTLASENPERFCIVDTTRPVGVVFKDVVARFEAVYKKH